jgi:ABC-type phosphate/phosphonate transport system substrate-binding protein
MLKFFRYIFVLIIIGVISPIVSAHAEDTLSMAFIYPGGEGSAEDAQPYLDQLFKIIHDNNGPLIQGKYYQSAAEGLKALSAGKIQIGIVSLDFYLEKKSKVPMEVFLSTRPLASHANGEQYVLLVESKVGSLKKSGITEVYNSRTLSDSFVKKVLFSAYPDELAATHIVAGVKMIPQLKKISTGEIKGAALLDSYEYASFKKLNTDWSKNLKPLYTSAAIPPSPVVLFKPLKDDTKAKLEAAMSKVGQMAQGKQVLESLRLSGFEKPNTKMYQEMAEMYSSPIKAAPKMPASSPN